MTRLIPFPNRATPAGADAVRVAYDALAPAYDAFTAGLRDDDLWLGRARADRADATGSTAGGVLDLACGTGKSFLPLLDRGYAVTACDVSPEMVRRAVGKAPDAAVLVADMRALPALGQFDLVTCLEDAFNCLLHADDVRGALQGIARSLAPRRARGVGRQHARADAAVLLVRLGRRPRRVVPRLARDRAARPRARRVVEARIDTFRHRGATWLRSTSRHRQRHWPVAEITRLAREAGLEVLEILGQTRAGAEPSAGRRGRARQGGLRRPPRARLVVVGPVAVLARGSRARRARRRARRRPARRSGRARSAAGSRGRSRRTSPSRPSGSGRRRRTGARSPTTTSSAGRP